MRFQYLVLSILFLTFSHTAFSDSCDIKTNWLLFWKAPSQSEATEVCSLIESGKIHGEVYNTFPNLTHRARLELARQAKSGEFDLKAYNETREILNSPQICDPPTYLFGLSPMDVYKAGQASQNDPQQLTLYSRLRTIVGRMHSWSHQAAMEAMTVLSDSRYNIEKYVLVRGERGANATHEEALALSHKE